MKIKPVTQFKTPENLEEILATEEYWEDDSFGPLIVNIQPTIYNDKEIVSYQLVLPVLENYENINGPQWETMVTRYISEKKPELKESLNGDSDHSCCVLWTTDEAKFKQLLKWTIHLLEHKEEIKRLQAQL